MERKRCQVCDGPIVNGRCKLCGMPYRNDETLYHLNESRRDHYRHATDKARVIMRQEEIPLGDKKPGAASAGDKFRQKTSGTYKETAKAKTVKKKKGSLLGWLIMLAAICTGIPGIRDSLRDNILPIIEQEVGSLIDSDSTAVSYRMKMGDVLEVGNDVDGGIVPGYYMASCEDGFVSFMILGEDGEKGSMTVAVDEEHKITLKEGDLIGVVNVQSEDSALLLTLY